MQKAGENDMRLVMSGVDTGHEHFVFALHRSP